MTTSTASSPASDKADSGPAEAPSSSAAASTRKSRRRRPSVSETSPALDSTTGVDSRASIDNFNDEDDAAACRASDVAPTRHRSSSTKRKSKRSSGSQHTITLPSGGPAIDKKKKHRVRREHKDPDSNNNENDGETGGNGMEVLTRQRDEEVGLGRGKDRGSAAPSSRAAPSRSRQYRETSAGPNKSAVLSSMRHADRPPSRQRHAFPTHLIDADAFCSTFSGEPATECEEVGADEQEQLTSAKNGRPPSRYMTKSNRRGQGSASATRTPASTGGDEKGTATRQPSRRLSIDYGSFSCNQTHHDPKTDGFADVDESIPPPFRIEVTTDSAASGSSLCVPPNESSGDGMTRPPPRRTSSFNSRQQTAQTMTEVDRRRAPKKRHSKHSFNPLQWFGDDDQINNPENFETIVTASNSPPTADFDSDGDVRNDDGDDEDLAATASPWEEHSSRPASTISQPAKSSASGEQSWMRTRNSRPLFYSPATVDIDNMDADTAIAQTPLYSSEDLMTMATEMSDLRLDDYSIADAPLQAANNSNNAAGFNADAPLHTSLGKDFLSLFAQH